MSSEPSPLSPSAEEAPDWILEVEGLGPIQRAVVEPAPLTILVGDNNSGKSYLATLLWGLQSELIDLLDADTVAQQRESLKPCLRWLEALELDAEPHQISEQEMRDLTTWAGDFLHGSGMAALLNRAGYTPKRLELRRRSYVSRSKVQLHTTPRGQVLRATRTGFGGASAPLDNKFIQRIEARRFVAAYLAGERVASSRGPGYTSFLPASRTGFMLLRSQATQAALQRSFGSEDSVERRLERLSRPMLQLMQRLVTGFLGEKPGRFADEAKRLEESLRGELVYRGAEVGLPEYLYRPAGTQQELTMHASSSMVTELAPILLTLRFAPVLPFLVIEEPEAHLHPRVQRALARTLVRLVRKGVRLVITTHSDLFCQQINNCIKLGERPTDERLALQKRLGYSEDEYLRSGEVRGYGFSNLPDGSGSEVRELERSPYGLVMPTFNRELDALLAETAQIDRAIPYRSEEMEPPP